MAKSSRERARALAGRGRVVEVGAGEGDFAHRLDSLGAPPLLIDPRPLPPHDRYRRVCARSPQLPLRTASCTLLVLANTLRHLGVAQLDEHAREWSRCLAGDGELWVLEDDPDDAAPAAGNYHRCLELLARADGGRGAALPAAPARAALAPSFGEPVEFYREANRTRVQDPTAPLRWLRATGTVPLAEVEALEERVRRDGMSYGKFWFGAWQR